MQQDTPLTSHPLSWRVALAGQFVFVFCVAVLSGPGRIDIVDGQTRYEVARSLVEHGDSVIRDKGVWFGVLPGRDGLPHTNYRFPQSGLGVLAIWLADATGPVVEPRRHFFFTLISPLACALLALTYALWFRGLGLGPWASLCWATAGVFCTPNWYYGTTTFDEMLGTAAAVPAVAVAYLLRERRPWWGASVAGLLLGLAFNCKQPLGLFLLPVLAAAYRPGVALRRQLAPLALILGGLAFGVAAYKVYDWYKFPPGMPGSGVLTEALYGPVWASDPLPGLAGLLVSPAAGALWFCPTLLLSAAGWVCWRRRLGWFCAAVLAASLAFLVFVSSLTFFKGDPCWGPRYLTPIFALWWVFVPAGAAATRRYLVVVLLGLGALVQILALSTDPLRLNLELGLTSDYFTEDPWYGFHPAASHLCQRGREISEILASRERAPEYTPGGVPTYAPTLPSTLPVLATSTVGLMASPLEPAAISAAASLRLGAPLYARAHNQAAVHRYHVIASFRPWWLSYQYLATADRPVDLGGTLAALGSAAVLGLALMAGGGLRAPSTQTGRRAGGVNPPVFANTPGGSHPPLARGASTLGERDLHSQQKSL